MSDENINPETGVDEGEAVNVAKLKAAGDICKAAKAYERGVLNSSELIEIARRDISSVLGGQKLNVCVEDKFAELDPKTRPHYE